MGKVMDGEITRRAPVLHDLVYSWEGAIVRGLNCVLGFLAIGGGTHFRFSIVAWCIKGVPLITNPLSGSRLPCWLHSLP